MLPSGSAQNSTSVLPPSLPQMLAQLLYVAPLAASAVACPTHQDAEFNRAAGWVYDLGLDWENSRNSACAQYGSGGWPPLESESIQSLLDEIPSSPVPDPTIEAIRRACRERAEMLLRVSLESEIAKREGTMLSDAFASFTRHSKEVIDFIAVDIDASERTILHQAWKRAPKQLKAIARRAVPVFAIGAGIYIAGNTAADVLDAEAPGREGHRRRLELLRRASRQSLLIPIELDSWGPAQHAITLERCSDGLPLVAVAFRGIQRSEPHLLQIELIASDGVSAHAWTAYPGDVTPIRGFPVSAAAALPDRDARWYLHPIELASFNKKDVPWIVRVVDVSGSRRAQVVSLLVSEAFGEITLADFDAQADNLGINRIGATVQWLAEDAFLRLYAHPGAEIRMNRSRRLFSQVSRWLEEDATMPAALRLIDDTLDSYPDHLEQVERWTPHAKIAIERWVGEGRSAPTDHRATLSQIRAQAPMVAVLHAKAWRDLWVNGVTPSIQRMRDEATALQDANDARAWLFEIAPAVPPRSTPLVGEAVVAAWMPAVDTVTNGMPVLSSNPRPRDRRRATVWFKSISDWAAQVPAGSVAEEVEARTRELRVRLEGLWSQEITTLAAQLNSGLAVDLSDLEDSIGRLKREAPRSSPVRAWADFLEGRRLLEVADSDLSNEIQWAKVTKMGVKQLERVAESKRESVFGLGPDRHDVDARASALYWVGRANNALAIRAQQRARGPRDVWAKEFRRCRSRAQGCLTELMRRFPDARDLDGQSFESKLRSLVQ